MFAGLYRLRVGRDLVQRLALETVEHPPSLATIADQSSVLQHFEMKGETRLRDLEYLLELADAAFFVRQHLHDLHPGFISQGMKPAGNDGSIRSGGGCHASNVSIILDASRGLSKEADKSLRRQPLGPRRRIKAQCLEIQSRNDVLQLFAALAEARGDKLAKSPDFFGGDQGRRKGRQSHNGAAHLWRRPERARRDRKLLLPSSHGRHP